MAIKGKQIASLNASKIGSGVFNAARIPDLDSAKIVSGVLNAARIPDLSANKIVSDTLNADRIPNLAAAKITSGVLDVARIPDLSGAKITSGTVAAARVDNLDTAKITSGTFADARIASSNVTQHLGGANVKTALGQSFPSNEVSIGDANATVTIPGNLTVSGTTTTINTSTLDLADHNISFDSDNNTGTFAAGAGFTIVRGNSQAALTFGCTTAGLMELKIGNDYSNLKLNELTLTTPLAEANVGNLSAGKITSGVLNVGRIPDLDSAKIASGVLDVGRIPDLSAAKITSGTLATDRIPNLDAAKITSGTFGAARLAQNSILADKVKWQKAGEDGPASPANNARTITFTGLASSQSNGIPSAEKCFVFLNGVLLEAASNQANIGTAGDFVLADSGNNKTVEIDHELLTDDSDRIVIQYIATA